MTVVGFLPRVDPNVDLHVSFRVEPLVAYLAHEGLDLAVNHHDVFGEAEAVDEALPALGADVDPPVAVHPVVPLEALGVGETLPAERARERPLGFVETDVALQRSAAAQDPTAFPALVPQQKLPNDG